MNPWVFRRQRRIPSRTEPSETQIERCADRARLLELEGPPKVRRAVAAVGGDSARVGEILAVQLEGPASIVEAGTQIDRVVAPQAWARLRERHLCGCSDYAEADDSRSNIAPGRAGERVVVGEGFPGVGSIERGADFRDIRQLISVEAARRRCVRRQVGVDVGAGERQVEAVQGCQRQAPLDALAGRAAAVAGEVEGADRLTELDVLPVDEEGRYIDRQPVVELAGLDSDFVVDSRIRLINELETL